MKQFVAADFGACGQLRMAWPASTLQVHGDQEVFCARKLFTGLPSTHVYIQRCAQKQIFDALRSYNGPKKIIDFDDQLFTLYGEGLPEYNFCKKELNIEETTRALRDGLDIIDRVTVSTEFLKKAFIDNFGFDRVTVIPNMLPRSIYHFERRMPYTVDLKRPRIVYAGGMTHYGVDGKDTGDFSPALIEFIKNNIDKIEVVFIGPCPWFFNDIRSKMTCLPFVPVTALPRLLYHLAPDFYLAPLRESVFNKCKSNLKYLEACAIGAVCIGSGFDDSPYSMIDERAKIYSTMNAKHIEKMFFDLCQKDNFNSVIDRQYKYINDNWLENNLAVYEHLFEMKRVTI